MQRINEKFNPYSKLLLKIYVPYSTTIGFKIMQEKKNGRIKNYSSITDSIEEILFV